MVSIECKINLLKMKMKNGKSIQKSEFEAIRSELQTAHDRNFSEKTLLILENYVYPTKPLNKWELFLTHMVLKENINPVIEFVFSLDDVKNLTINMQVINEIENKYEEVMKYLNNPDLFSEEEREKTIREINKKIKVFRNRLATEIDSEFCAFLKKTRLDKGLSLKDIEDMTGISSSHVHRVENGNRKPSIRVIEKLSKALDIPSNQFLKKMNVSLEQRELVDIIDENLAYL